MPWLLSKTFLVSRVVQLRMRVSARLITNIDATKTKTMASFGATYIKLSRDHSSYKKRHVLIEVIYANKRRRSKNHNNKAFDRTRWMKAYKTTHLNRHLSTSRFMGTLERTPWGGDSLVCFRNRFERRTKILEICLRIHWIIRDPYQI